MAFGKKKKEEPVELEELDSEDTSDLIKAFERQTALLKKINLLLDEKEFYDYRSNIREVLMISSKISTGNLRNTEVFQVWCETEEFFLEFIHKTIYPEIIRSILALLKDTEAFKQEKEEYQNSSNISKTEEEKKRILLKDEYNHLKDEKRSLDERLESIRCDWKEDPTQFDKKVLYQTLNEIKERNSYCDSRITEIEEELGEKKNEINENC